MPWPSETTYPGDTTYPGQPLTRLFIPPYAERGVVNQGLRYKTRFGISVLRIGGVWQQVENPSDEQITAADRYYAGGHIHTVTADEAVDLIDAGYGDFIT